MIDIKYIREHPEEVKKNILNRQLDPKKIDVDKLLDLDKKRLELIQKIDNLRAEINVLSSELKDSAKRTPEKINKGKELKEQEKSLSEELGKIEKEWQELMDWIP
ncbi:MAG: serine--tRNA ligase, partial [Candidatus Levybacteria bacterium]|nr:serine--tRNA ligase [Candidatus Levybacteria bacterium]